MCFIERFLKRIEEEDNRQVAQALAAQPKPQLKQVSQVWRCSACGDPLEDCVCDNEYR